MRIARIEMFVIDKDDHKNEGEFALGEIIEDIITNHTKIWIRKCESEEKIFDPKEDFDVDGEIINVNDDDIEIFYDLLTSE